MGAAGGQQGDRRMLAGQASTQREGPRTPDRGDDAAHLVQLVAVFRQPEGLDQRTHDLGLLQRPRLVVVEMVEPAEEGGGRGHRSESV